jgi:hypothetical protein
LFYRHPEAVSVDFDCPTANLHVIVDPPLTSRSATPVGEISDSFGDLSAMEIPYAAPEIQGPGIAWPSKTPYVDCHVGPEDAPDSVAAYRCLRRLVLGDGAERLNEDQWAAIRKWVMGGGSLVMFGGAGSLGRLAGPVASELCPLANLSETSVSHVDLPRDVGFAPVNMPVAVVSGTLKPGSEVDWRCGDMPLLSSTSYGLGAVTLVGFNPTDAPFKNSPTQNRLLEAVFQLTGTGTPAHDLSFLSDMLLLSSMRHSAPASGAPAGADPFRVKLPGIAIMLTLLCSYFILVVPVTYFVLRRKNMLSFAWITIPAIAIVFALFLAAISAKLYSSGMSRYTAEFLVSQSGATDAYSSGISEVFFPVAGTYNVSFPHRDAVELEVGDEFAGYSGASSAFRPRYETQFVGDGVAVGSYSVSSLCFQKFDFSGPATIGKGIRGSFRLKDGKLSGTIVNGTGYALGNVIAETPGHISAVYRVCGGLPQGQSASISSAVPVPSSANASIDAWPEANVVSDQKLSYYYPTIHRAASTTIYVIADVRDGQSGWPRAQRDARHSRMCFVISCPLVRVSPSAGPFVAYGAGSN